MDTPAFGGIDEVVAAVPAMLGFYPTDSIIAVMIAASGTVAVCVPVTCADTPASVWATIARQHRRTPFSAMYVIVVADDMDSHRDLVEEFLHRAQDVGVAARGAAWTARITADGAWASYLDGTTGRIPDPGSADLTADVTADGEVIFASRDAIRDACAPTAPADTLAERGRLIDTLLTTLDLHDAIRIVETATSGALPHSDTEFARLVAALHHTGARDAAYRGIDLDNPAATAALWQHVLRNVAPPHQAFPATLFAVAQLLRGDGPLADAAIDLARDQRPGDIVADLLCHAIAGAISPAEIRALLTDALA